MHKVFLKNIKTTKTTNFFIQPYVFGPLVSAFANKSKIKLFLPLIFYLDRIFFFKI